MEPCHCCILSHFGQWRFVDLKLHQHMLVNVCFYTHLSACESSKSIQSLVQLYKILQEKQNETFLSLPLGKEIASVVVKKSKTGIILTNRHLRKLQLHLSHLLKLSFQGILIKRSRTLKYNIACISTSRLNKEHLEIHFVKAVKILYTSGSLMNFTNRSLKLLFFMCCLHEVCILSLIAHE